MVDADFRCPMKEMEIMTQIIDLIRTQLINKTRLKA